MTSVEQLQKDITSARTALARLEGQQEVNKAELDKLYAEAKEIGIAPDKLADEALLIQGDVEVAVKGVDAELDVLTEGALQID